MSSVVFHAYLVVSLDGHRHKQFIMATQLNYQMANQIMKWLATWPALKKSDRRLTLHYDRNTLNPSKIEANDGPTGITSIVGGAEWQEPHSGHSKVTHQVLSVGYGGALGTQPLQDGVPHCVLCDSTSEGEAVSSCCDDV